MCFRDIPRDNVQFFQVGIPWIPESLVDLVARERHVPLWSTEVDDQRHLRRLREPAQREGEGAHAWGRARSFGLKGMPKGTPKSILGVPLF